MRRAAAHHGSPAKIGQSPPAGQRSHRSGDATSETAARLRSTGPPETGERPGLVNHKSQETGTSCQVRTQVQGALHHHRRDGDVTYRIEDKKGKRTVVNGERLITFVKPDDWSSTDGVEDELREHVIETSVDSENEDDGQDVEPKAKSPNGNGKENENSQRTSGRRERRVPQRYGCT